MTFGEKLYELRKGSGVSQEALARELHVSRQAISRWELGDVVPDTENVLAVSRYFGVSMDYLLREECLSEQDTPVVQAAERSLKQRQLAVGEGFACRIMLYTPIYLYHQTALGRNDFAGESSWYVYLLVWEFLALVGLFRLNWRYYAGENGAVKALLLPDTLALLCICTLPRLLAWLPRGMGLLFGQMAAIPFLVMSVKALRLHYGLPWGRRKKRRA